MFFRHYFISLVFVFVFGELVGQDTGNIVLNFVKKEAKVGPGKVVNLAFTVQNLSADTVSVLPQFSHPDSWDIITKPMTIRLSPNASSMGIVTLKSSADARVGLYPFEVGMKATDSNIVVATAKIKIEVLEVEDIVLQLIDKPGHVLAGEKIKATYLLQNLGNTEKKIFMNTSGCDFVGSPELRLQPGESVRVQIEKSTSADVLESKKESYTLRAQVADRVLESVYTSTVVLQSSKAKKDLFFRFPVKASATYLSTNRQNEYQSGYQFQLEGEGTLDVEGNHQLGFLARFPNNSDFSFMGLYDQYYVFYKNKNANIFLGEKSYSLTPLTENSRFGRGVESKITLNNGFSFGGFYTNPRFFSDIENEWAGFSEFSFNKKNKIGLYYLNKKYQDVSDPAQLYSVSTQVSPLAKTMLELELSRGEYNGNTSNAIRGGLNGQISIFQFSGLYYNVGQFYPGYYANSRFYSVNISAHVSKKLSLSFNTREDFSNAQLDTFFVTAPYSKSYQGSFSYKLTSTIDFRLYWREYERKDRSSAYRFHYQTTSWNTELSQKIKRFYYSLSGEIGETNNLLREPGQDKQNSYKASVNMSFRINSNHSVRVFGNWSNINQFVSNNQQSVIAGLSASSRISKNLRLNAYVQNAYEIDDYYRNRNLMQLNLDYKFLKKHTISLRSFYTLFRNEIDNPEFSLAATYSYQIGVPLKQVIKSGRIAGRITNQQGEPVEGVFVQVLNETTVSDEGGEFSFKTVPPGRQLLVIDRTKMDIDEIASIPMPIEIDILEDEETPVNIQIQKGAVLKGKLKLGETKLAVLKDEEINAANIVVELKTEFENYRIATGKDGSFEFPLVRPGIAILHIYASTIPVGYGPSQSSYTYELNPGDHREVEIILESKKKNIIFKPSGTSLSTVSAGIGLRVSTVLKPEKALVKPYYTIQIGAFRKKLDGNADFFSGHAFYFEKQIDNFHKYFVGKFETYEKAQEELEKLLVRYKNAFIVIVNKDKIVSVSEFRNNSQKP